MGRVEQGGGRPLSAGLAADRHHKQLTNSAKPSYKVIFEEVTQTRKALRLEDYHNIEPPKAYRFVPAGDPTLTTKCKELARLDGKLVYAVTTANSENELSRQVHRVGFHFPAEIVQRALTSLGIDLDQEDKFLRKHEVWPIDEQKRIKKPRNIKTGNPSKRNGKAQLSKDLDLLQMSQEEVDAQAKAAILDMFPAMPVENLYQIILHSFELGSDKVGVQLNDLSLPRRVQLAVVAHIRHVYTDYDTLLHTVGWQGARAQVAAKTLEVLAGWRGDKDDDIDVVEDILREVIVISDDEEEPQNMVSQPVKHLHQIFAMRGQEVPSSASPLQPRPAQMSSGRFEKSRSRRNLWRNARERRKELIPLPQARANHSYYIPRPGREAPINVDRGLYERRLRELENMPQETSNSNGQTYSSTPISTSYGHHEKARSQYSLEMHRHPNKTENVRQFKNEVHSQQHIAIADLPSGRHLSKEARAGRDPQRASQRKLELVPVSDEILPSIETPRTERAIAPVFARGAIHVDSPPPTDPRIEYRHLRHEPENVSPVKRKRAISPTDRADDNYKQVVYLPIRETQAWRRSDLRDRGTAPEAHKWNEEPQNRILYLPLDENNNFHPYRGHQSGNLVPRTNDQIHTSQVYLNSPVRTSQQVREDRQGLKYQYIPLLPARNHEATELYHENEEHRGTRLVPLAGLPETTRSHQMGTTDLESKRLVSLESPRRYDRLYASSKAPENAPPHQILDRMIVQHAPDSPRPSQYPLPYGLGLQSDRESANHGRRNLHVPQSTESIPYNPHDPKAGLSSISSSQMRGSWR